MGLTGLAIDGGIAVVSRCMARAFDERISAGRVERLDRVLLLDDPGRPPPAPVEGVQRFARSSQARFVWQLWRLYQQHRHDLVVFDHVGLARACRIPAPHFPPRKYAIFLHGTELRALSPGRHQVLRGAKVLLANSRFTAAQVLEIDSQLAARINVVDLCIDPDRIRSWERADAGSGAPTRKRAALIVGRMWSEERGKGHDELIAAWPRVVARVPDAELWIGGDGDDRPRLEEMARSKGLAGSVRFFGRVSDAQLSELYSSASAFAMPSRQEGFGLVYAEAMWHGLPCIGSSADAAGQVILDGKTGLLVPYGDVPALEGALISLLSSPEKAAEMGRAGAERARRHFTYERFRRELLEALDLA